MKTITTLFILGLLLSFDKIYGQADPGSSGISFSKTHFSKGETGTLEVNIGNYSSALTSGTAVTPYDATFTITIPFTFEVTGSVNFSKIAINMIITSEMKTVSGSSVIVLTVPKGIAKGDFGTVVIPVRAVAEHNTILYATIKTEANLTYPPSGNATPNNDLQYAPVYISGSLPVTLKEFKTYREQKSINLSWSTTEEANSERFDIERSLDGNQWQIIGSMAAEGNSKEQMNYTYIDENPAYGSNYYRLKMIDKDQTYAYSWIRQAKFEDFNVKVYPNPVTDLLRVDAGNWENVTNIQLISTEGNIVYNSGKSPSPTIDIQDIKSGIHIVKILRADGSAWTSRILIANRK